jgi:hypothetical protein
MAGSAAFFAPLTRIVPSSGAADTNRSKQRISAANHKFVHKEMIPCKIEMSLRRTLRAALTYSTSESCK